MNKFVFTLLAAAVSTAAAAPAFASAFTGGTVINVPRYDTLNIRKWPSATSRIIEDYRNNERISLTGRCKNIVTNASFRIDMGGSAGWNYSRMERANIWCQVMTDDAELGWARGKFIWPQ